MGAHRNFGGGVGASRIGSVGAIWGTRVAGLPQRQPWEPEVREAGLSVVTKAFYGFAGVPMRLRGLGEVTGTSGGGASRIGVQRSYFGPTRGRHGCKHGHLGLHADRALYVHPGCSRVMGYIHWSHQ